MNEFAPFQESVRKAGITPDQARYWLSLLGIETFKSGKFRYVPILAIPLLQLMGQLVGEGVAPAEAAKKALAKSPTTADTSSPAVIPGPRSEDRLKNLEKAVLTMAESFQAMAEENKGLRLELAALKVHLLPPPQTLHQVIPWQPKEMKDPLLGKPWWERIWIQLVHPESCRRETN